MAHVSSGIPGRIRSSIVHWFQSRIQECVRCSGCDGATLPFVTYCPKFGQANPTQVSISAAVVLVLGFMFLAVTLSVLVSIF